MRVSPYPLLLLLSIIFIENVGGKYRFLLSQKLRGQRQKVHFSPNFADFFVRHEREGREPAEQLKK